MKKLLSSLLFILLPALAEAQTVRADRFTLATGPCTMRSGIGSPTSGLGFLCDTYLDTSTGVLWLRQLTGWVVSGVTGTGTVDTVAKWTTSSSIGNSTITDISGGNMTIAPAGDLITNPTGNDILPTLNYDINIGLPQLKYLSLNVGELFAETLVAQDVMSTIGGRILVGPTTLLTGDLSPVATTIVVKHNNLSNGDIVFLQSAPGGVAQVEFIRVTSGASGSSGAYSYSVTRNLDATTANQWYAGDAVFNTGQTGNGFIDIYSTRGVKTDTEVGPTIVGNVRLTSTYNDWSPRWAIGNLNGLYGYSGSTYGAAFGVPTGARVTIDSTNGVIIYGGDNDPKVTIDTSGNATFDGKLTVGTGRNILRNSECRVGTEDWGTAENHGLTETLSFNLVPWNLNNESSTCYVEVTGSPAAATVTDANLTGQFFPATANARYEASVYIGLHRASQAFTFITWRDSAGATISTSQGTACTTASNGGRNLLGPDTGAGTGYCRSVVIASAPVGTFSAQVTVRMIHDGSANPFVFWVRNFFGEASTTQQTATDWGPAGVTEITGGIIKTDTITAREIAALTITAAEIAAGTITAAKLNVGTLSSISADIGTITAGSLTAVSVTSSTLTGNTISGGSININSSAFTVNSSGDLNANVGIIATATITDALINDDLDVLGTATLDSLDIGDANAYVCSNNGVLYASSASCDGLAPSPATMLEMIHELRAEIATLRASLPAETTTLRASLSTEKR